MTDWLYDVEGVCNRPDKSILKIQSMCPELLLSPEVASPHLVKHLTLNLSFSTHTFCYFWDTSLLKYLRSGHFCDCKPEHNQECSKCDWTFCYTNTLCKDLVNFTNLETFTAHDIRLSSDLWINFARNSRFLKKIIFQSEIDSNSNKDYFEFDGGDDNPKNDALDAIVKIPTLTSLKFDRIPLAYFPPGPSSLEDLYIDIYLECDLQDFLLKWTNCGLSKQCNLSKHQTLKTVTLGYIHPWKFSELQMDKLQKLEELNMEAYYRKEYNMDQKDIESLKRIIKMPSFKRFNGKNVKDSDFNKHLCEFIETACISK